LGYIPRRPLLLSAAAAYLLTQSSSGKLTRPDNASTSINLTQGRSHAAMLVALDPAL